MERLRAHVRNVSERPMIRQFVKFSIVGVSNTVVDFGTYVALTRLGKVHFIGANVVAFLLAATWSYIWNRKWTFRSADARIRQQYVKFLIVAGVGLGLTTGILYALVTYVGMMDIPAKVIAIGVVLIWNFLINRLWTFRDPLVP